MPNAMINRLYVTLTSRKFNLCLGLLLLNDWWLKSAQPGVLSGKLSDFAGLAVVAMLLMAAWPSSFRAICLAMAGAFLWWKSPLSQPTIEWFNAFGAIRIGRTIDYTDLVALAIVPACKFRPPATTLAWATLRRLILVPTFALTLLGTMGTSAIQTREEYSIRRTASSDELRREAVADAIATVAKQHGLEYCECSNPSWWGTYSGKGVTLTYSFQSSEAISFQVQALPSGIFFGATGQERANALRVDLIATFARSFRGLEFVESLDTIRR